MSKAKIIDKKSVDSVLGEKNLLSEIHHPFIVNMIYSFQDHDYLYLVMDLLPGGNLRYHISSKRHFNEKQNKFLIGCILVGLEYIHGQNILHRDIKPENLVFDSNGYLRITDFGIAKKYVVNNKKDTSGTVGYLAPEVLCNENHTFSIDYYAVGIITYELAYGHRPYIGKTKHEVKQLILTRQAHIDYDDLPEGYENEAADFINKLIQRKPKNRLGKGGIKEVINHPWLKGFDWESMKSKSLKAYYLPKEGDNYDKKYCLQNNKMGTETIERYKVITDDPNYEIIFKNFDCEKIPEELKIFVDKNKIGDSLINNANISSNNSTTSISRNNKINFNNNNNNINNNDGNKKNNNKYPNSNSNSLLARQRNKSMENIFIDQKGKINIDKINGEKSLVKQISAINIISKKNDIITKDDEDKIKKEENKIKKISNEIIKDSNKKPDTNINVISDINEKEHQKKEYKIIFNKKSDNNYVNKFSFRKKYSNIYNNNNNENKDIYQLKDTRNNLINNQNQNPNISNNIKEKNILNEYIIDINNINKEKEKEKEKKSNMLMNNNNSKMTNLNKYISNNYNYENSINKSLNKTNKLLSNSNSSINLLSSELFANIKGNYFKKIINSKLYKEKDSSKIKNKDNNSLVNNNSAKSLFKNNSNSNIHDNNYLNKSKKHFLKKELFNGTFYPNKSVSTRFFVINTNKMYKKRKQSATLINKNVDNNSKKLVYSSSMNDLIYSRDGKDIENISGIFSKKEIKGKDVKNIMDNIGKKLPFINDMGKNTGGIFRNNLHFINRNANRSKNLGTKNGFFSERLKNYENKKLKSYIIKK